jgi:DNA invertase Pin-like site-specific DNA recombinase
MRAAIYARVFTKKQDDAIQLDGKAGIERPGLERLLKDARLKKIDIVLVYKLDRFGRSLRDVLNNIEILDRAGVRFIVPQQGLDTDKNSAIGRFLLQTLGAVAELERSFIVERTSAGYGAYREAYAAGEAAFHSFLARRGRHSKSGKDLAIGRPRRIFDRSKARNLRAEGKSVRQIAEQLGVGRGTIERFLKT